MRTFMAKNALSEFNEVNGDGDILWITLFSDGSMKWTQGMQIVLLCLYICINVVVRTVVPMSL